MKIEEKEHKLITVKAVKKNGVGTFTRFPNASLGVIANLTRAGYNTGLTDEDAKRLERELGMEEGTLGRHNF